MMSHIPETFENLPEFDALAQSIAAKLACDVCMVSIVSGNILTALGHSDSAMSEADRTMPHRDTICGRTVRKGVPLRVPDLQQDQELRDIPAVKAFNIGAYLGVPLKAEYGTVIGAICVLSTSPRIWRDSELEYLIAVSDLAESKIERHLLRYEQRALSEALAENDAILSTLSQMKGRALTVHNADGEVVFANSAMHTDLALSDSDLLALPCITRQLRRKEPRVGKVNVVLPAPTCTELNVQLSDAHNGLTLAEWSRD